MLFSFINLPWIFFSVEILIILHTKKCYKCKISCNNPLFDDSKTFLRHQCNSISSICLHQALCIFLYKRASVLNPKSVANNMWLLIFLYILDCSKVPIYSFNFKCEQKFHISNVNKSSIFYIPLTTTGDQKFNNKFF